MSEKGAKAMAEVAQTAAEAAHEVMGAVIDGSKLSEHRKIGACITAVTAIYAGLLDGILRQDNEHQEHLAIGMFNTQVAPALAKIALNLRQREKGRS